jgi:hypothetical protein
MMPHTLEQHFENRSAGVRAIYERILGAARTLGDFEEDPKKTSIHLNRNTAFAGVQTRRQCLILTLKSDRDIDSGRVVKREQTLAHRWHIEFRIERPDEIDLELQHWLEKAYELSA